LNGGVMPFKPPANGRIGKPTKHRTFWGFCNEYSTAL
jgi:hypothetical protein